MTEARFPPPLLQITMLNIPGIPIYTRRDCNHFTHQGQTNLYLKKTNVDNFDPQQQSKFSDALEKCDINELTDILVRSSSLIDINKYNLEGQTPLQAAIVTGQLDLVKQLIRHGADPNMRSRDGWSTLHIAAFYGNSEITQYLLMLKSR